MTSRLVAAARARESKREDRLFNDPFAAALAGDEGRAMAAMLEGSQHHGRTTGIIENPYLPVRTRFLDDFILQAAAQGIKQFAILAAGMDARAFRLDWPEDATVFEVERAEVLEYKESILAGLGAKPRVKRVVIAMDLREDFCGALIQAGFVETEPTLFLTEGLLPYLPNEEAVLPLLSRIAAFAAPGSLIALDTIAESFFKSPWTKPFLDLMAQAGAPWLYGTDEPESLLERAGFSNVRAQQPGEVRPDRWPFPVMPRSVPGMPRSFLVTATRQ